MALDDLEETASAAASVNGHAERTKAPPSSTCPSAASVAASGKKTIVLKSPMGGDPMVYAWPLKKGKGSMRRSEVRY